MNAETQLFYIALVGVAVMIVGFLWLIVAAFRVRKLWGIAIFVFPPLGLVFGLRHRKAAAWPVLLMVAGLAVGAAPIAYNKLTPIDLGPREKLVNDEIHLTLTGWDRQDYSVLAHRPTTVVLQMANDDVTDQTLAYLKGMTLLRELDLNGSRVDDEGLSALAELPSLEALHLRGTKITDAGFRKWLADREKLRLLDLRGTGVTKETGRAWKVARPDRRLMQ